MSSLIRSPELSPELVRMLAFGDKPTAAELHATGVDIELLETVYSIVKPELRFFPGEVFEPLSAHFFQFEKPVKYDTGIPWGKWFEAALNKVESSAPFVLLANTAMDEGADGARQQVLVGTGHYGAKVQIFLGKGGLWLVWTNYPDSRFETCRSPREAMRIAHEILPQNGGRFYVPLALHVAQSLRQIHARHVETREARLQKTRERQTTIGHLLYGIVS